MKYFNGDPEKDNQVRQFVFMRHGITEWNWRMIPDGPKDWGVSEAGKRHIKSIVESLDQKGIRPTRIIASPLKRCIETADIVYKIFSSLKLPAVQIWEQLRELYHGDWSLERQEEAKKIISAAARKFDASEITEEEARETVFMGIGQLESPLDAEPWESFIQRVQGFDNILAEQPDRTFVIGHGTAIEEYLKFKGLVQLARDWQKTGDHRPCIIMKAHITKSSNNGSPEVIIDRIEMEKTV